MATPAHRHLPQEEIPCFHCTFTPEFHDTVIQGLASLKAGQDAVIARLDKMNGSVAELFKRSNEHDAQIAVLDSSGSKALAEVRQETKERARKVWERVEKVEQAVAEKAATERGARAVLRKLEPAIWMAASALIILFYEHGSSLLAILGKK